MQTQIFSVRLISYNLIPYIIVKWTYWRNNQLIILILLWACHDFRYKGTPILFIGYGLCSCNYAIIKAFVWENDSTQKLKDCWRYLVLQTLIREYINDRTQIHDVNTSLEKVENILITTAKQCSKIKLT